MEETGGHRQPFRQVPPAGNQSVYSLQSQDPNKEVDYRSTAIVSSEAVSVAFYPLFEQTRVNGTTDPPTSGISAPVLHTPDHHFIVLSCAFQSILERWEFQDCMVRRNRPTISSRTFSTLNQILRPPSTLTTTVAVAHFQPTQLEPRIHHATTLSCASIRHAFLLTLLYPPTSRIQHVTQPAKKPTQNTHKHLFLQTSA
jgi:hypothetical protein